MNPQSKEKLIKYALVPIKAYVIAAFPVWFYCNFERREEFIPVLHYDGPSTGLVCEGYFASIIILLAGLFLRKYFCNKKSDAITLIYVGISALVLLFMVPRVFR